MVKAKKYIIVKHFNGEPKRSDLQIVEEELPALEDGEFLCKAVYLSVDPHMRVYMNYYHPVGATMIGTQIARIVESRNTEYPVGKLVVAKCGWKEYSIEGGKYKKKGFHKTRLLPDLGKLPSSLAIGVLGTPGNTAYFGFLEICKPKPSDVVVVTSAAGAVGSVAGQIAKIKGCKVIGFVGTDAKCKWLKNELGFDYAFNYKTQDASKVLMEAAPDGVDCFFDNVGGELAATIMMQMKTYGRVAICGSLSAKIEPNKLPQGPMVQLVILRRQLKVEGFLIERWTDRWLEGIQQLKQWVDEGKIKYRETITYGFDNMYEAFIKMLHGDGIGKTIVQI